MVDANFHGLSPWYVPRISNSNFDLLIVQIPISEHGDADPAWQPIDNSVMAVLDAAIQSAPTTTWITGSSPVMTVFSGPDTRRKGL